MFQQCITVEMPSKKIVAISAVAVAVVFLLVGISVYIYSRKDTCEVIPFLGPIELPKAPHWDERNKSLYFVDVYQSVVHRWHPDTQLHTHARIGTEPLAFIIPITNTDDKFIVSYGSALMTFRWNGVSDRISNLEKFSDIDPTEKVYRANEGKVSPTGMLLVGTHSPQLPNGEWSREQAALYGFRSDGSSKKLLGNVSVSNGMAWSSDGTRFFYIDSLAYNVQSFVYDLHDDSLHDRRILIDFREQGLSGVPDGMAIDEQGKIWVTSFGGHQVLRLDPDDGKILHTIDLDALQVTSAAFAGDSLCDLYITTGMYQLKDSEKKDFPHSGYIFRSLDFEMPNLNIQIAAQKTKFGTAPYWDEKKGALFFSDLPQSRVYKYVPQKNEFTYATVGNKPVSMIIPVEDEPDKFLITYGSDLACITWDEKSSKVNKLKTVATVTKNSKSVLENGKVGPRGNLVLGSHKMNKSEEKSNIYSFVAGKLLKMGSANGISKDFAWSADGKTLYFTDAVKRTIDAYDYDPDHESLARRRTVLDFVKNKIDGTPSGLIMDADSRLWVASFGGSKIFQVNPVTGIVSFSLELQVPDITSLAFGGDKLEDLYVTSAASDSADAQSKAGHLFIIGGTGAKGLPSNVFRLN